MPMFLHYEQPARRNWNTSVSLSLALHGLALFLALLPAKPIFVKPSSIRLGERGTSLAPVYLARPGIARTDLSADHVRSDRPTGLYSTSPLTYSAAVQPRPIREHRRIAKTELRANASGSPIARDEARAGSPYGSVFEGPIIGEEVRPALPVVGPQPFVGSSELPNGMIGDVVVEVTIDEQGNVVQTSLLHGVGSDVDRKVLATLQNWHFRPATRDGSPIPSKQDVYFHFGPGGIVR